MSRSSEWWDNYLMGKAEYASRASKDPRTKVGAIIVREDRSTAADGYNGFPRGVADLEAYYEDRDEKIGRVVHAELNAILACADKPLGATIYVYGLPCCSACAAAIIQAGIKRVVYHSRIDMTEASPWKASCDRGLKMFAEADVPCERIQYA